MIEIFYIYKNKNGLWTYESKHFNDVKKATRFCWMMKHKSNMFLDGYACIDAEDEYYLEHHVNEAVINGMAVPIKERRKKH